MPTPEQRKRERMKDLLETIEQGPQEREVLVANKEIDWGIRPVVIEGYIDRFITANRAVYNAETDILSSPAHAEQEEAITDLQDSFDKEAITQFQEAIETGDKDLIEELWSYLPAHLKEHFKAQWEYNRRYERSINRYLKRSARADTH